MANYEAGTFRRPTQITTQSDDGQNYRELSLQEYLKKEIAGEKKNLEEINRIKLEADKARVDKQKELEKQAANQLADIENNLKRQGLEMTNAFRKKLLQDFEKERSEERRVGK